LAAAEDIRYVKAMQGLARMLRTALLLGAVLLVPLRSAHATQNGEVGASSGESKGKPIVKLDKLVLPPPLQADRSMERRLRFVLRREVRRVDWGAGRGKRIEYRFYVDDLVVEQKGDVLRVRCRATGQLPGGKTAKSSLSFGGDPKKKREVVQRVLEIVARGVIARLAQLERQRRTGSR
jgi:hypothetical protein